MNSRFAPVVVLFVVIFAVLVFVWGGGGEPAPAPTPGPAAAAGEATGAAGRAVGALAGEATKGSAGEAAERRAVPTAPSDEPVAAATIAVRGRLVDASGAPIAEVPLRLREQAGMFAMPLPEAAAASAAPPLEARSGADGRFAFRFGRDQGGALSVVGTDLVLRDRVRTFPAASADLDLGDLAVARAAAVAGVVRDGGGRPVAGVRVSAHRGEGPFLGGNEGAATTGDDGAFRIAGLRPGRNTIRTASPRHLPAVATQQLGEGEQVRDLVLVLQAGNAIAGQVVDDRGLPVTGIRVGAMRHEERGALSVQRFAADESTTTDEHGWFTLAGLVGETATVRAWGEGHATVTQPNVPTGTSTLLLRALRFGSVRGVLRDRAGQPIAGSRVTASEAGAAVRLLDGDAAVTAADGTFRIDDVPPGTVQVMATGDGHRPAVATAVSVVPGGAAEGVVLVADRGAVLRVTVVDHRGEPVADARVEAVRPAAEATGPGGFRMRRAASTGGAPVFLGEGEERLAGGSTDARGVVELAGLPEGAALVRGRHDELAEGQPVPVTLPVAGAIEARVTLRPGGSAEITVVGSDRAPVADAAFVVTGPLGDPAEREHRQKADGAGRATLRPLPPGAYRAELEKAPQSRSVGDSMVFTMGETTTLAQSRVEFTVQAGAAVPVTITRPVLARLSGTVSGPDGPQAGIEVAIEKGEGMGEMGVPTGQSVRSGADGSYALAELEAGAYTLRYGRPGQVAKAEATIDIPAGVAEVQRDLALRTGQIRVQAVSGATGAPLAGAEVTLQRGRSGGEAPRQRRMMMVSLSIDNSGAGDTTTMTMGGVRVRTGPDGVATIDDVPEGTWTVRITHDRHAPVEAKDQQVVMGATLDCGTLRLSEAGGIRGTATDIDGKPLGLALVSWRKAGSSGEWDREPAMGGTFSLKGLEPGRYVVRARQIGPQESAEGQEVEVEVKAGEVAETEVRTGAR